MCSMTFDLPGLEVKQITYRDAMLIVHAASLQTKGTCPRCSQPSYRLHSSYQRSPQDLPIKGRTVRLVLQVRRFRCLNSLCQQQTFSETFPGLVARSARQTSRLISILRVFACSSGSELGAHLLQHLGAKVSPDTLLRLTKVPNATSVISPPEPHVIGPYQMPHGSLPYPPLTSFVGSGQAIAEVKKLLTTTRLLTLTGIGGSGKTRLALNVATELLEVFNGSVRWVDVVTLTDPARLLQSVAAALGVYEQPHDPLLDTLLDHLRPKKLLLVLDHCEHVVTTCAHLVESLLLNCPYVQIIATSREVLHLSCEVVWSVRPLSFPASHHQPSLTGLMQYPAIQLFVERASAVQPSFVLTRENVLDVVHICRRLDGIPLLIELAAMRMNVLSVGQIATHLDHACQFLTNSSRTVSSRHQSAQALIDWSYNLLTSKEQTLFCRLSVFDGGVTLKVAEMACSGADLDKSEILDLLAHLVDKSLLIIEDWEGKRRYRLPEVFRQYAAAKLQALSETTLAQAQAELCIFGLGSTRVIRNQYECVPSDWRYTKARDLLFYLLCYGAKTKEQIGLALWPEASSAQLRHNFHSTLYHLRRTLGRSEWIVYENGRYSFNRQFAYWFDVEAFEFHIAQSQQLQASMPAQSIDCLKRAIKIYRGDFLEDCSSGEWYLLRQNELGRAYFKALLVLGELLVAEKRYELATDVYHQLIARDSLLEVAHRELMRCYALIGERSQALQQYQSLVETLYKELGTTPAPETTALFEHLLQAPSTLLNGMRDI